MLLTPIRYARIKGVSYGTIYKYIHAGLLPYTVISEIYMIDSSVELPDLGENSKKHMGNSHRKGKKLKK